MGRGLSELQKTILRMGLERSNKWGSSTLYYSEILWEYWPEPQQRRRRMYELPVYRAALSRSVRRLTARNLVALRWYWRGKSRTLTVTEEGLRIARQFREVPAAPPP